MPFDNLVSRGDIAARVPEQVSQAMLTNLAAQSVALRLGQRIPLASNQTRFPVLSALPTAYFVAGDTGLKQTTEAAWDNKYLYVEEIATIVPIPEAVLDDAGFDVWGSIQPLMEAAIVRTLDAAVLFGTNAPTTWANEGSLVGHATAAGNAVARTDDLHGDLADVVGAVELDGFVPNGAIGNITVKGRLRGIRTADGAQMQLPADVPPIEYGLPGLWPTGAGAAELLVGDFSSLVIGVRQDMTYKLITEGVITDNAQNIVYNLPQQDMVALRLVFRAGYAISNPINYQNGDEATRSPFGVLTAPAA